MGELPLKKSVRDTLEEKIKWIKSLSLNLMFGNKFIPANKPVCRNWTLTGMQKEIQP